MRKIISVFLLVLIFMGITMSILNFTTKVYAKVRAPINGTITPGDGTLAEGVWQLAGRLIGTWGGTNYYCCEDPSNCVIVFAN